jgi:hypothetical protein
MVVFVALPVFLGILVARVEVRPDFKEFTFREGGPKAWWSCGGWGEVAGVRALFPFLHTHCQICSLDSQRQDCSRPAEAGHGCGYVQKREEKGVCSIPGPAPHVLFRFTFWRHP